MGIQNLLRHLSPLVKKSNVRQFSNQTLAVDASSWLHKAAYACAPSLVESIESSKNDKNKKIDPLPEKIITRYIIRRCEELLINAELSGIILVIDGMRCPLKKETNDEREEKRRVNLTEARRLQSEGRGKEAAEKYRHCIKVTDELSMVVARAIHEKYGGERVRCLFAPYEADAQLVSLCVEGLADGVITEDSDVLVYAAAVGKVFPILYKLDRGTGGCDVIDVGWLVDRRCGLDGMKGVMGTILRYFVGRKDGRRLFVQACVLAGCDYAINTMQGVGLVTAFKMVKENAYRIADSRFEFILHAYKRDKKALGLDIDVKQYEDRLAESEAVFFYHYVWRAKDNDVVTLMNPKEGDGDHILPSVKRFDYKLDFIGSPDVAKHDTDAKQDSDGMCKIKTQSNTRKKRSISTYFESRRINNFGSSPKRRAYNVPQSHKEANDANQANPFSSYAHILSSASSHQQPSTPTECTPRRVTIESVTTPIVSSSPSDDVYHDDNSDDDDETKSYAVEGIPGDDSNSSLESVCFVKTTPPAATTSLFDSVVCETPKPALCEGVLVTEEKQDVRDTIEDVTVSDGSSVKRKNLFEDYNTSKSERRSPYFDSTNDELCHFSKTTTTPAITCAAMDKLSTSDEKSCTTSHADTTHNRNVSSGGESRTSPYFDVQRGELRCEMESSDHETSTNDVLCKSKTLTNEDENHNKKHSDPSGKFATTLTNSKTLSNKDEKTIITVSDNSTRRHDEHKQTSKYWSDSDSDCVIIDDPNPIRTSCLPLTNIIYGGGSSNYSQAKQNKLRSSSSSSFISPFQRNSMLKSRIEKRKVVTKTLVKKKAKKLTGGGGSTTTTIKSFFQPLRS